MFSENIINLTCCIISKMPAFRVDKLIEGRVKCRSPMLKRTWWNSLALFLIVNLQGVLKQYFWLDLIDPRSSLSFLTSPRPSPSQIQKGKGKFGLWAVTNISHLKGHPPRTIPPPPHHPLTFRGSVWEFCVFL